MKRILLSILATMTASLLSADLPKHPPEEEIEKQKKSILEQKTDRLDPRSRSVRNDLNDQKYFNGSHWYLMAGNDGAWGHNYEIGAPGGLWPRGSSHNIIFSAGLWIGSEYDGDPRVSKVHYDSDFIPGVLDGDPYSDDARVLKVNRWDDEGSSQDYADWASYDFTPKAESEGDDHYPVSFNYMDGYASSDATSQQIFSGLGLSFSVEVWYKNPGVDSGNNAGYDDSGTILTNYRRDGDGDPYNNFGLNMNSSLDGNPGKVSFQGAFSNERLDDDQWHHVAGVYDHDNGIAYLFVDGVLNNTN